MHFVGSCVVLWLVSQVAGPNRHAARVDLQWRSLLPPTVLVAALGFFFRDKLFVEDFAGDGVEHFEYARSLLVNVLPVWDMENGVWSFHHRFLSFAFPSGLSMLVLGPIEAAVRLPGLWYLFLLATVIGGFLPAERRRHPGLVLTTMAGLFLLFFINAFYSTWDPWVADIAEPTTTDLFTIVLVVSFVHFLLDGRDGWAVASGLVASVSVQYGAPLVALCLALAVPGAWRSHRRVVLALGCGYIAILALFSVHSLVAPRGDTIYTVDYLLTYWAVPPDLKGIRIRLVLLLMTTAAVPVLATPFLPSSDRASLRLYTIGGLYAGLFVLSSRVNPHYFVPPAVFLLIAFLQRIAVSRLLVAWSAVKILAVGLVVAVLLPKDYRLYHGSSQFAATVRLDATDYRGKVALAEELYEVMSFARYGIGHHTLVHYSEITPCDRCALIFSTSNAPTGYETIHRGSRVNIHRLEATSNPFPSAPLSRYCPDVLRKLYTEHRLAIEGALRGPARLPWSLCLDRPRSD